MTTNRPYRRALPLRVALRELRECAGTQFDPRVAKALIAIVDPDASKPVRQVTPALVVV
jgi:HD-GYP domain-containing protein (c-di-GMP phosphodiesterase class II)